MNEFKINETKATSTGAVLVSSVDQTKAFFADFKHLLDE